MTSRKQQSNILNMLQVKKAQAEIWRPTDIDGVSVSNLGRVRRDCDGFIYKLCKNSRTGYNYVDLRWRMQGGRNTKVARLVATAFVPNPENKPCVDHINTIRDDDRATNLRWCTRSENMNNPITKKKILEKPFRESPKRRKAILQYDLDGNFIREWDSATSFGKAISKDVGGNIIACIKGKQPSAYGYKWKYKDEYDKSKDN